jgi:hypothetical protein
MNGLIRKSVVGLCLGTGIANLAGCYCYRQAVDPCWMERYDSEARMSVRETLAAQVHNGHVLDQTMWGYHFEADPKTGAPTDKLNAAGMDHLNYLSRRQPASDPHIFLQTVQDVPGGVNLAPDKFAAARADLDNKRVTSIQKYLASVTNGRARGVAFDVTVTDVAEPGISAAPIGGAGIVKQPIIPGVIIQRDQNFKGKMDEKAGVLGSTSGG